MRPAPAAPLLLALAVALVACAPRPPAGPRPPARQQPPPPPPAVVVTLVVDQLAAWVADARLGTLPDDGGFARLRREGTWHRRVVYDYAVTDTAPGHAALYTSRPPRATGIFGNEVLDAAGARVSILRDEATRAVGVEGVRAEVASSIARLRAPTLADALRAQRPDAVIVSLSIKDRGAIFGGGRRPSAVVWFDPGADAFVTSTAFAQAFPAWAAPHADRAALDALRATPWEVLDEPWVRAHAATADDQPGEGDLGGFGTVFPHSFARARRPAAAFRASPRGDEALLALATAAVERARDPRAPMLLAVSLSSNDYIGHVFGPDSWEAWDELRRLDAALARFFRALDRAVGADRWAAVLAADHGVVTLPEAARVPATRPWCAPGASDPAFHRPCVDEVRIDPDALALALDAAAVTAVGPGRWVLGVADPYVFLTPAARALPAPSRAALLAALRAHLLARPGVRDVIDPRALPAECPADPTGDAVPALVCRSMPPDIDADLYVVTRVGGFFDPTYVMGFGTSHGTPYRYDRTIPLLARAPGHIPAGRVVDAQEHYALFASTAARLLGVPWPSAP